VEVEMEAEEKHGTTPAVTGPETFADRGIWWSSEMMLAKNPIISVDST
jgi:hypothetical protein